MSDVEQPPEQPQEQTHPATRQLMSLHVPPSDLQKYLDRVDYLGSRGLSGLGALKNYLNRHKRRAAKAKDPKKELEWFALAPLHGACMNGHVNTTLPYIYETMGASLNTLNKEGNTPLHQSVIWGRNACVVWLLEKGCDITVLNKVGDNALEMAIKRQAKLNDPELQSKRLSQLDRDKLLSEGVDLINILKGVSEAPNYQYWAKHNPRHALVIEYSPWSMYMDNRVQLMLLRELVLAQRAVMLTKAQVQADKDAEEERLARAQHDRAQNIASQASKVVYPELHAAMTKDLGHLDMTGDAVAALMNGLSAMKCTTYVGLAHVDKDMIGRCGNLDAGERRKLWIWVKEQKEGPLKSECDGGEGGEGGEGPKTSFRKDPRENMSKTAIKKYEKRLREIALDEEERRTGLNIVFKAKLPDDAFRFMMGFLY